jgi:CO/xanthine dehydrogenase FAD-binding subunit
VKPAAFVYHAPTSVEEALATLAELGDEAKPLAGGQSLVPLMNFRLARPAHLVDLNRVAEMAFLKTEGGTLSIGAMTRQREIERSRAVADGWPLLAAAVGKIGHVHIRNRGTIGGSLAHADPAAELPATMLALDATVVLRGPRGARAIPARDLFASHYTTTIEPDELLTEIQVPALLPNNGWAFEELTLRHGDFAIVGVAALLTASANGTIGEVRLAFAGAGATPLRAIAAERILGGERPSDELFRAAGNLASQEIEPDADIHATAEYRREIAAVLTRRALTRATADFMANAA